MESKHTTQSKPKARFLDIHFIPPKVFLGDATHPSHLHDNNKLLSDVELTALIPILEELKNSKINHNTRITKTAINQLLEQKFPGQFKIPYDIAYVDGQFYAIYFGKKKDSHLGGGTFGVAKLAQNIQTGEWVVQKNTRVTRTWTHDRIDSENAMLKKVDKLKGSYYRTSKTKGKQCETFMEYETGTNLEDLSFSERTIPLTTLFDITLQFLADVQRIHSLKLLHRDIKGANIICNADGTRLIDFGFATMPATLETNPNLEFFGNPLGTPRFMAPEIFDAQENRSGVIYSVKTEIYAIAITLVDLFGFKDNLGRTLQELDPRTLDIKEFAPDEPHLEEISRGTYVKVPRRVENSAIASKIIEILNGMVSENPKDRLSVQEAFIKFEKLRQLSLDNFSKIVKVAYIDPNEFLAMIPSEQEAILKSLNEVDEVHFVAQNNPEWDLKRYSQLKQNFEKRGFIVSKKLIEYDHIDQLINTFSDQVLRPNSVHYLVSKNMITTDLQRSFNEIGVIPIKIDPARNTENERLLQRRAGLPIHGPTLVSIIKRLEEEKLRVGNDPTLSEQIDKTLTQLIRLRKKATPQYAVVASCLDGLERSVAPNTPTQTLIQTILADVYAAMVPAHNWALSQESNLSIQSDKFILELMRKPGAPELSEMKQGTLYIGVYTTTKVNIFNQKQSKDHVCCYVKVNDTIHRIKIHKKLDKKTKSQLKNKILKDHALPLTNLDAQAIFDITSLAGFKRLNISRPQQNLLDTLSLALNNPSWEQQPGALEIIYQLRQKLNANKSEAEQYKEIVKIVTEKMLEEGDKLPPLLNTFLKAIYQYISLIQTLPSDTDPDKLKLLKLFELEMNNLLMTIINPTESNQSMMHSELLQPHTLRNPEVKEQQDLPPVTLGAPEVKDQHLPPVTLGVSEVKEQHLPPVTLGAPEVKEQPLPPVTLGEPEVKEHDLPPHTLSSSPEVKNTPPTLKGLEQAKEKIDTLFQLANSSSSGGDSKDENVRIVKAIQDLITVWSALNQEKEGIINNIPQEAFRQRRTAIANKQSLNKDINKYTGSQCKNIFAAIKIFQAIRENKQNDTLEKEFVASIFSALRETAAWKESSLEDKLQMQLAYGEKREEAVLQAITNYLKAGDDLRKTQTPSKDSLDIFFKAHLRYIEAFNNYEQLDQTQMINPDILDWGAAAENKNQALISQYNVGPVRLHAPSGSASNTGLFSTPATAVGNTSSSPTPAVKVHVHSPIVPTGGK